MIRKTSLSLAALAAMGIAGAASAQQLTNPWAGDGAEVDVEIIVGAIGEVYSAIGTDQARNSAPAVGLEITNAAGNVPSAGIAEDTLFTLANVNHEVSVELDGDIPEMSRFHIVVNPSNRGSYDAVAGGGSAGATQAAGDQIITWDRRDAVTGYLVGANEPNSPVAVLTGTPVLNAVATPVDYVADAIHGLPPVGSDPIELIYTIAQN